MRGSAAVAYRLALAGRALCPEPLPADRPALPSSRANICPRDRPLMIARYGLDRGPGVLAVARRQPGRRAPASSAGDVLLAVNGARLPIAAGGARRARPGRMAGGSPKPASASSRTRSAPRPGAAARASRAGARSRSASARVPGCFGRVQPRPQPDQVNAFSNGRDVVIDDGDARFRPQRRRAGPGPRPRNGAFHPPPSADAQGDKLLAVVGIGPARSGSARKPADRLRRFG